jgi:4-hydroxymandelate oxidase
MTEQRTRTALNAIPAGIHTALDYRAHAEARLAPQFWRYLEAGSGNNLSLAANLQSFTQIRLMPRMLADLRRAHTRLELFGQQLDHPLLLAPVAYQRIFHRDAEPGSIAAADAQGGIAIVSSLASTTLEEIADAGTRPQWFQLYWQGERERSLRLVRRAIAAGYSAIVFTVDAPVKQAAMQLPPKISAINLEAPLLMPPLADGQSPVFDGWMAQAPTWEDLAWLRDQISVPLLLKGVLHGDDARQALALGCDGLIVSNHGGRVLDGAPTSIDALPAILKETSRRVPVLLDSGIRNGSDVFKAIALGASAVLIGRPYIWGLAAAGALGVAHVLRLLRDELEMTMALTGCASLSAIGERCLIKPV